jgi:teichuronic acid biosynthesis glycosyltransferase TuaC
MNILFVSSGNALNGISPLVENQGKSLLEYGHQVDFFTIKGKGLQGYINANFKLRRYLKAKNYDLIHAHYGLSGIIALLVNRRVPLVVSFMGDDLLGSNLKNGKFRKSSLVLTKINCFLAAHFYSYSIVKSEQMFEILKIQNAEIIPNGVDLKHFIPEDKIKCRQELNLSLSEIIIVFVSNPERPEKNYSLAQKAVRLLNREDIRLIPVFDKMQNEIYKWLNASDLVVLTSFHEGSPNIIKEAMACNCVVVSTDVGDVRFIFGDTAGYFLGTFNPNDFAETINQAILFSISKGKTEGRRRIIDLNIDTVDIAERITMVYKKTLKIN